jgi:hypothetical protein
VKVSAEWKYLYRAVDSQGQTNVFMPGVNATFPQPRFETRVREWQIEVQSADR